MGSGLLSALLGFAAWALFAAALLVGGLDASGPVNPRLFIYPSLFSAFAALTLGVAGLARGRQRLLAAVGLAVAGLLVLSFIGVVPL
jgi:hypothetical protein